MIQEQLKVGYAVSSVVSKFRPRTKSSTDRE